MLSRFLFARLVLAGALFVGLSLSCIGTDYVDEPAAPEEVGLALSPSMGAIQVGETLQFSVTGNAAEETTDYTFVSDAPTVASIDDSGLATGEGAGQATIQAIASSEVVAEGVLTVVADPTAVAQVTLSPSSAQLQVGDSLQFQVTVLNLNDEALVGREPTFTSSAPGVVDIDTNGLATASSAGAAEISATVDGIKSMATEIRVFGDSRTGAFQGAGGYSVSGGVTLKTDAEGKLVLEFGADFSSSNGPQLEVLLSEGTSVTSSSLNLGTLKNTSGTQTYEVENSEATLGTYHWVHIHCIPFDLTFGKAELQ